MNSIFLDASFWIVYREEKAGNHTVARRIMSELFRRQSRFVTTLPVVCEIHAYFAREEARRERILKDFFSNPIVAIENILPEDQASALELLQAHGDKTYSLCDALSFIVMQRLNVRRVLAFDVHFRQFGEFEILA
jgi:uncharacterized protein